MLVTRTALVGVLLVAAIHFGLMALRHRQDVVRKLAAVFAQHACVVIGARVLLASDPSVVEATIATRLLYSALVCGAVVLPAMLDAVTRRQVASLGLGGVVIGLAIWGDGWMFDPRVVRRAPIPSETYDVLAPGPCWWLATTGLVLLMAASAWLAVRTTEPALRPVVRALSPLIVAAMTWDVVLDAGLAQGPILGGWVTGVAMTALAVVAFRRAKAAHGDLVDQLEKERLALEREQELVSEQEHMGALGSLAEGLGHELNNPLAAVSLNLAWLEDELSSAFGTAPKSLRNARRLTRDLEASMHAFTLQFRPDGPVLTSVPPTSAARRAKPRVLVVDDDPLITKALRRSLTGFDVTVANSADEALGAIGSMTFDAVLCDVMMPEVTGVDFYHQVARTHPDLAKRFVLLTGGTFGDEMEGSVDEVPCPVLKKPIDVPELAKVLRRRIASARNDPDDASEEGPQSLGSSGRS